MASRKKRITVPAVLSLGPLPKHGLAEDGHSIDASNFRFHAKRAIKRYQNTGKIMDALIWGTIIGNYEALLAQILESRE